MKFADSYMLGNLILEHHLQTPEKIMNIKK